MLSCTDHDITMGRNRKMSRFGIEAAVGIVEGGIASLVGIFGNQQVIASKYTPLIGQIISQQAGIVVG
ncbi:hypothetical protein VSP9026_03804 [Vibrio spartinae]|uniref:Uncharacterized protein n=1 Tax=Vibrio spartinae TaxID=1918945 RepID=A0A1N6M9C3_9VIBR|nr:hypothetical protein VSP9026_03804 [Vibrio spartinae]